MVLNLSHFDKDKTAAIVHHKDLHVGFFVASVDEVDRVHARIIADGVAVDAPKKREGRYAFYVKAPGGFDVEVATLDRSVQPAAGPGSASS
jgi:hypothetical protein